MANSSPDYKKLFLEAKERQTQTENEWRSDRERSRRTTLVEFMRHCHNLLSRPLGVASPSRSTAGKISLPIGKYCPLQLKPWLDCSAQQQEIYTSVSNYLQPAEDAHAQFFTPLIVLEEDVRRFGYPAMNSEQDLAHYERVAVESQVRDIIEQLCKIDAAREEFRLGDGVYFENYTNSLDADNGAEASESQPSKIERPKADSFFIHRVDGNTRVLLATVEYKPPHKLSVEALRVGLREMDLYKDIVRSNKIPTDEEAKAKYDVERLVYSAIVQEYHVMILEGLEYSYVTTGIARVLLRVPRDDPSTLYYHFCDPNSEVDSDAENGFQEPKTSIARVLCLCLMAFRSSIRDHEWRHHARQNLQIWDSSFSQVTSSPSTQRAARQEDDRRYQDSQSRRDAQFCTQRCLLGLQTGGDLDNGCPNVKLHRRDQDDLKHPITSDDLVRLLNEQLDDNIDRCIPFGRCGSYGAPLKLTCIVYGYTVIGKGTTSNLWKIVSSEAQVYRILRKAQGSAVPVFLGTIDLAKIYFLHGAGQIRHMLVMGWGGQNTAEMEMEPWLRREIRRSTKEINALGVVHDDLRYDNILWNKELGRALIIDFHRATLHTRSLKRSRPEKGKVSKSESGGVKRLRLKED